jgi:hypothetical protein
MSGGSRGISKVCISENGTALVTVSVSRLPFHRWKAAFKIPNSANHSRILTISGLSSSGSVLTQTERLVRIIPSSHLVLKKWRYFWDWHYEFRWQWDFTFGKYVNLYTISGLEKDGWTLSPDNKLFIPKSCNFPLDLLIDSPGTVSMISLFLDTKLVSYGIITVKLKMDLCPNDILQFELADSYSTITSMGTYKGRIENTTDLGFNLKPYIGHDLEFRMIFKAMDESSGNCGGISVSNLEILSS